MTAELTPAQRYARQYYQANKEKMKQQIVEARRRRRAAAPLAGHAPRQELTDRELKILDLVVLGHTNKEIATEIGIAIDTVKNHLTSIFNKLEVRSRAEAIALVLCEVEP